MGNAINTSYEGKYTVSQIRQLRETYGTDRPNQELMRMTDFTEAAGHIFSENMIKDMADLGFFRFPASLTSHGTHIGGLYDHSMAAYRFLRQYTDALRLTWQRPESPLLVAIFHDWVKLQSFVPNDDRDGDIDIVTPYIYNSHKLLIGHGEVSVIMAQQFLQSHISAPQLTEEEIVCIRYHMGAFTEQKEWEYYTKAIKAYPNVLWTHTADMMASQIMGI